MVLLAGLFGYAPSALAYRAPYADSDVTLTTETISGTVTLYRVRCTIHDPVSNQDVAGVGRVFETIDSSGITDGIVYVAGKAGSSRYVWFSVYVPGQKKWIGSESVRVDNVSVDNIAFDFLF
jgi:hypothetical protein